MAAASSATAYYIAAAQNLHVSSKTYNVPISLSSPTYFRATKRLRRLVLIRNSGEESATTIEEEFEAPLEVPKGPPSLISTLNVEKILRGLAITEVDHYGMLGLQNGCSIDQVNAAYKNKVAEVMNKGLDEEEASKELELLKESYTILSSVEEKRLYDWSLARTGNPDKFVWPFEVDKTPTSTEDPPPQEPEDEGPTRLTGYIFLIWFILSLVLLIAFNR